MNLLEQIAFQMLIYSTIISFSLLIICSLIIKHQMKNDSKIKSILDKLKKG